MDVDASSAPAGIDVGSWRVTGLLPAGHYAGKVVTLAHGRVLDMYRENENLATALYEPSSGTWRQGPALSGKDGSTIVPLADGGALLIGETVCSRPLLRCSPTSATYRLDTHDSAWTSSAPMHEARTLPAVARLADGRVLVAGGFGDSCTPTPAFGYSCAPLSSVELFDPHAGVWSSAAPLPTPRGAASATLLTDGTVLLVGGGSQANDALRYNPVSGSWTTLGPSSDRTTPSELFSLPGDRAIALGEEPGAGFYGSYGGAGKRAQVRCDSIPAAIYTAAHNMWIAAPLLPGSRFSCSIEAALLTNGQILYSGEEETRYVLYADQRCWAETRAPVTQHQGLLAALPGGRALDLGPDTEAEVYTPGLQVCTTAQRIQTSIFSKLAPLGRAVNITTVLSSGYSFSLAAIRPGKLRIDWYYSRRENEGQSGMMLVGAGRANLPRRGSAKLAVKLTAAGRELLEQVGELQLIAKGAFTSDGVSIATPTRTFTLAR